MDSVATTLADRRSDVAHAPAPRPATGSGARASANECAVPPLRALPPGRGRASDTPVARRDRSADEGRSHNLPGALTSFIGREQEIAEARRLLGRTRLLTLTGTGGVGKTRLGREVAASLLGAFHDGVWLVELAAVTDPTQVPRAAASVLGLREQPERSLLASVADALRPKRLLLVLDNCEHLIEACADLADVLLRACPDLYILATSRQPLGIAGETTLRVPSLSVPPCPEERGLAAVAGADLLISGRSLAPRSARTEPAAEAEAVRLFVERARAVAPSFSLTERNAVAVRQICRRLDGIPLAIELAAARVVALSPEQIAIRLRDRFRLLTGGSRTALPRFRTLRALIDWSHDLLDEREAVLLRRLAVFAGGWTLEAAEAVCAGDGLDRDEILDLLSGLVAKSLALPSGDASEVRYRFLESLREYAGEKLRDSDEEPLVRERHRRWFVVLAERAEPELIGPHQEAWLDRLDRERENLRAAQRSAFVQGDVETLVRFAAALWRFWWARADAALAHELIDVIVPLARQIAPTPALARALHGAGMLAGTFSDFATCRSLLEAGLAVARQLDDRRTLAVLLDSLGRQLFVEGCYVEARVLLNEGLAILREIDDRHGQARALSHLGFLEYLEDRQESARAIYHEGLELAREGGDTGVVAEFLDNLGRTYLAEGDLERAECTFQEAVAIWRENSQGPWLAMALNNLGCVKVLRGELGAARAQLAEALTRSQRMGNRRRTAFVLSAIATLAAVAGQAERAVRLEAAASAAIVAMGAVLAQPMFARCLPHIERCRQVLGTVLAEEAAESGRATTLVQAVGEALVWLAEPERPAEASVRLVSEEPPPPVTSTPVLTIAPVSSGRLGLSRRELEVAALIAQGMSNRQIANELVITEGTAANHVKHILARLVLDSRVQIATWAIERGLNRPSDARTSA